MVAEENTKVNTNVAHLEFEFNWLKQILKTRVETYLGKKSSFTNIFDIPVPTLNSQESIYSRFVEYYQMTTPERITLLLALAPHVSPQILDIFLITNPATNQGFTEFGGIKGQMHGGFLPSGDTVLFVLAANNIEYRFQCQQLFDRDHFFMKHGILKLEDPPSGEPAWSGQLVLSQEIIDLLTAGKTKKPHYSQNFPARLLTTKYEWSDLVLNPKTQEQLQELLAWTKFQHKLMEDVDMKKKLCPGYRSLFYGPSGTGKTLTAALLGRHINKDVYRIDLSTVVSKYIGETEKNLEKVFERAENTDCILFFDEADALYGKRTNISDSHDRYANQEVAYLLQRIEEYPGLVILASNFKSNLDDAFLRRFQSLVHFPMPEVEERHLLWSKAFPKSFKLEPDIDLKNIAGKYRLAGGSIMNIIRYALLMALQRQSDVVIKEDLIVGIRREFQKEGKTM